MEKDRNLENGFASFVYLFNFLFDGVLFGFRCDYGAERWCEGIEAPAALFRIKDDQFRKHETAENLDDVFVFKPSHDPIKKINRADPCIRTIHEKIQCFVSALAMVSLSIATTTAIGLTYFTNFKPVVHSVLKRPHLDQTDKLRLEL